MCIDDASGVVVDTIEIAENQIRKDRQQEKQIIIVTALISVFILLIDQIGWSVENIVYTGTGVVLPMMSILTFFCFSILSVPTCVIRVSWTELTGMYRSFPTNRFCRNCDVIYHNV